MADREEAHLAQQAGQLAARIMREVLAPYFREHQAGQHGPVSAADCHTICVSALAHALVPSLMGLGKKDREELVATMAAIALDAAEDFEAMGGAGLPAGQNLQ